MTTDPRTNDDAFGRLMRRWFVEYNPLALASAALVLGGIWLLLREAANEGSALGALAVAGLAEVYALALIGGAAFLARIELRRPAVMLGLLAALYQGDLTMHVETCAYLGDLGRAASAAWAVLFAVKLLLLCWALRLRASRSALLVPIVGAVGLAAMPHLLREVGASTGGALIGLFVFGLGAAGLWTERRLRAASPMDPRGRRSLAATWGLWAALGLAHALYWCFDHRLPPGAILAGLALLAARWARRERAVWALVASVLAATFALAPSALWQVAWMAAALLVLRALRTPRRGEVRATSATPPYRGDPFPAPPPRPALSWGRAEPRALARLATGATALAYLGAWTAGWRGGALPDHLLALDLALAVAAGLLLWRTRRAHALAPPLATATHLGTQQGWIALPRTALEWGLTCVGLGFAALLVSLLASWRWRARDPAPAEPVTPRRRAAPGPRPAA